MDTLENKFKEKLSNYHHLATIREQLWPKIGKSKVTVMVGAGFSLNAQKLDESLESMSKWSDIEAKLKNELGYRNLNTNLDVLAISEEYEKEFGRNFLDSLLKKSIPDEHYEPDEIHKSLLRLPWSDIYTTNYDTLLEKTLPYIIERNYNVIRDIKDIPNSVSPRIVKLHGSFPSTRPFIFTKTDFESYRKDFAPLVNMVQQSIMETTFILLGFSGDDPNFEQWIKWVEKNLDTHMPKIYMIAYGEEDRKFSLEQKNITVIDFKEVYKNSEEDSKYKIMADFIMNLAT